MKNVASSASLNRNWQTTVNRPCFFRTCDQLRCTDCDFKVSTFDNFQWKKDTDYLFLRNNMPEFDRLKSKLTPRKGADAFCSRMDEYSRCFVSQSSRASQKCIFLFQACAPTLVNANGRPWVTWNKWILALNGSVGSTDAFSRGQLERNKHSFTEDYLFTEPLVWSAFNETTWTRRVLENKMGKSCHNPHAHETCAVMFWYKKGRIANGWMRWSTLNRPLEIGLHFSSSVGIGLHYIFPLSVETGMVVSSQNLEGRQTCRREE